MLKRTNGSAPPISKRSVMPTLAYAVIVLLVTRSVSDSVSNGAASSGNGCPS